MNTIETNVMTKDGITPPPSTQHRNANELAIDPKLQRWINFCEQTANEVVEDNNYAAQFLKNAEDNKKARAENRLMVKLRKMEVEQKAVLLAEAQKKIEEARREFESQEHPRYDYTPIAPGTIEEIRAHNDLRALEREQKEELLKQVMEKRAKEAGDDWPRLQEMSQDPRFDHIPKYYPGEKEIIAKAFPGASTVKAKESDE
jgi:hypothetical protein